MTVTADTHQYVGTYKDAKTGTVFTIDPHPSGAPFLYTISWDDQFDGATLVLAQGSWTFTDGMIHDLIGLGALVDA